MLPSITWKARYDSSDPNCPAPEDRIWFPGAKKATRQTVRRTVPMANGGVAVEEQEILTVEGSFPNRFAQPLGSGYRVQQRQPSMPWLFVSFLARWLGNAILTFFTMVVVLCAMVGFPMIGWAVSDHSGGAALLGFGIWLLWVAYLCFSSEIRQRVRYMR